MKTIRVRIGVALDRDGEWSACGFSGGDPDDFHALALEHVGDPSATYWLEADLPIPEQQTFEATVSRQEGEDG